MGTTNAQMDRPPRPQAVAVALETYLPGIEGLELLVQLRDNRHSARVLRNVQSLHIVAHRDWVVGVIVELDAVPAPGQGTGQKWDQKQW